MTAEHLQETQKNRVECSVEPWQSSLLGGTRYGEGQGTDKGSK